MNNRYLIIGIIIIAICVLFLKHILIFLVRCYQRFAPREIRDRCLFTPTCSEFMILSIQKYGVLKGVAKGIDRLKRCHYPNGGEDYP